ncbi:MAG TPA: efflux RND transporter periplasmic adaptor subunit [Tepidisphaeraceae bacterium]|jgi:RND family efflux transporter MFP subunit|nr:efflux RND transporter periplasmic adaptor subunit [Tepidisphaeraceae bacterium]
METSQLTAAPPKARPHRAPAGQPGTGPGSNGNDNGHGRPAAPDHDHDEIDLNVPHPRARWIAIAGILAAVCLVILFVVGLIPRLHTNRSLAIDADAALNAPVPVNVVLARRSDATMDVVLPGTLRPWQEVSIYARSTGYLKKFYVDISNQVKAGQLMADISSPEVDQQLVAAKASLVLQEAAAAKAKTDMEYAQTTDQRYESLRGSSSVTQQQLDQFKSQLDSAVASFHQAEAQVGVSKANVQQLTEMQSFEKIIAPFSGVVTGRAFDVGAFIMANPTATDIVPMFKIAENDVLRAFVNVPQNYALTIRKGMKVNVSARELPGRTFVGVVLGTTNYLDPAARSLLTEVRIENPDFALLPGMFISADFHVTRDSPPWLIPAPALVINADGNHVAVVQDNKVHFKTVTLGVDYGNDIEILTGLDGNEKVIGNPGEKTVEGAQVKIAAEQATDAPAEGITKPPEKVTDTVK